MVNIRALPLGFIVCQQATRLVMNLQNVFNVQSKEKVVEMTGKWRRSSQEERPS